MLLETWLVYVAMVLAPMSTPGPSQLLMLSNSLSHGLQRSLATACGDLSANALQMLGAGLGLATLIAASEHALLIIKWFGVAYLTWLGFRMIYKSRGAALAAGQASQTTLKKLWLQGFLTSATNPKAVVFFAALFPQFIHADAPFWPQFFILSVTYIIMDGLFLSGYGIGASWVASRFKGTARMWIEHIGGGFMIGAAVLLGLKTVK